MAAHVAMVNMSGLLPDCSLDDVKVRVAVPHGWETMPVQSTPIYVHQQWRSLSRMTGVGVVYIHMPLPMSAKMLVWFAKRQYSKQIKDTKVDRSTLDEWTDPVGREWFEGENQKYHLKGYVVTNGMDAWAVYIGYRLHGTPRPKEISMGFRSMDSIVPLPLVKDADE